MRGGTDARAGGMDEAPVWIAIDGVRRVLLTCSPADPAALALGHLLAEGWLGSAADVAAMQVAAGPGGAVGVDASLVPAAAERAAAAERLRRHQLEHGCGLRHFLDCAPLARRSPVAASPEELGDVFRALFAAADAAAPGGGVHAAALTDGAALLHASVDVARHCAVDRALGHGLQAGAELSCLGLVTTSRISGAMALKAVRSGVAWAASRSRATPLARELAEAAGLPLLEHAARRRREDGG